MAAGLFGHRMGEGGSFCGVVGDATSTIEIGEAACEAGDRGECGDLGILAWPPVVTDSISGALENTSRVDDRLLMDECVCFVLVEPKASELEPPRDDALLPHRFLAMSVPRRVALLLNNDEDDVGVPGSVIMVFGKRSWNKPLAVTES